MPLDLRISTIFKADEKAVEPPLCWQSPGDLLSKWFFYPFSWLGFSCHREVTLLCLLVLTFNPVLSRMHSAASSVRSGWRPSGGYRQKGASRLASPWGNVPLVVMLSPSIAAWLLGCGIDWPLLVIWWKSKQVQCQLMRFKSQLPWTVKATCAVVPFVKQR